MNFLSELFFFLAIFSFGCLVLGLVIPWIMLWWEDIQNRRKVIKLYGTIGCVSMLLHIVLKHASSF